MNTADVDRVENAGPITRGLLVWYPLFGGIGAWTVHLIFLASSAEWVHENHAREWLLHGMTVVCVIATVAALLLARRLVRVAADAGEEALEDAGQLLFLGRLSLLIGAINLALILLEELYVVVLPIR